jgi:uncharacterized protein
LNSLLSMKKQFLLMVIFCFLIIHQAVFAVRVPGLYDTEVPIQDQETTSRTQAVKTAMKQVLVKLTGERNSASRADLMPIIATAENYVQQYRYLEVVVNDDDINKSELRFRVSFDESKLNNALRKLGVQVWGRERPSILIWLAMEENNSRKILIPEEDPELFEYIDLQAATRGIVLINPLFDLQDSSSIRASDIWGEFHYSINSASQRYYPDIILTGKIFTSLPDIWEGNWTVYIESVLNEGINGVADIISVNYAQHEKADIGQAILKVIDVITVQQYAKVLGYLQTLSPVSDVEVVQISPGMIEFNIYAHGGIGAVTQAINFGRILEPVGNNLNTYRVLP